MKILYLDFLYPMGHIRQNKKYISLLSNIAKVYVICEKNRYTDLPSEVEIIENSKLRIRDGQIATRVDSLKAMIISAIEAKKIKPDYIFISSYDTIMFTIGRLFFSNNQKLFLLQHSNIDELASIVKKALFKSYVKSVNLVVFENFIKDYLLENFKLNSERVFILPHQLNQNSINECKKKYHCVGLSFSNDEDVIAEIIDIEKREDLLKKQGCKVILKSKISEFDNGFLKVFKGYLDNEKFNEYIDNSISIYMPFSSSFRYRMSGTLMDALSNDKILLGSNIPIINYYSSKYPSVCIVINSVEDFFTHVCTIKDDSRDELIKDFEQFRYDHSEENVEIALKKIFRIDK